MRHVLKFECDKRGQLREEDEPPLPFVVLI